MSEHTPEPMTSNRDKMRCPVCGSQEVDATTPRTVYECNSSDYDQRPETFKQSEICAELAALRAQVAERDSAIDSLRETIARQTQAHDALRAQVEEKNKALEPFARFAKEVENMVGNFPKTGAIYGLNVTPEGGGAEITIEDLKAALAATSKENA